jgi:hypothetical protein
LQKAKVDPRRPTDEELADRNLCYIQVLKVKWKDPEGFERYATQSDVAKIVSSVREFY